MNESNITEFTDYKTYLKYILSHRNIRGLHGKLAKAAGCQSSYLSQVFSGKVHLTTDQAHGVGKFLELPEIELEYFLLLVEKPKTASATLKQRIDNKLNRLRIKNKESTRHWVNNSLADNFAMEYYSSWAYPAVRSWLPEKGEGLSETEIAEKFGLKKIFAKAVIKGLERMGLAKLSSNLWVKGDAELFRLTGDSPMYNVSHLGNRIKTVEESLRGNTSFNFSCWTCVDAESLKKIQSILEKAVADFSKIEDGKEKTDKIFLLCMDFIKID